jgi:uncharacterized membrane protein YadS
MRAARLGTPGRYAPGLLVLAGIALSARALGPVVPHATPLVPAGATQKLTSAYRWLFLLAFAGLGLDIDIGELRATGLEPVAIVLIALLTASAVTLLVLGVLFSP